MKAAPCPVPSETRKLNRLMTALHVKLMPKVDMVEARGGVDVETEDVVGYGHPMVRVPHTSTPACYFHTCNLTLLHHTTLCHTRAPEVLGPKRVCSHSFHSPTPPLTCSALLPPSTNPPQTRLLMLPPSTPPPHSRSSGYAASTHSLRSQALFPDDNRPKNVKEEEKEAKALRLTGPQPGDMHGKNPPAWTTGKTAALAAAAAAAKEEQEMAEAEAGKGGEQGVAAGGGGARARAHRLRPRRPPAWTWARA